MPIVPLPQFEEDLKAHLDERDRAAYEALKAPTSVVVRFGTMKMVGEFPYAGSSKPGCGSKLVVRSWRGVELGEMLTSTCPNSGCSKSVSRQEMLRYIDNSGGRDYPFHTDGKVLRIATKEDLDKQEALEQSKHELRLHASDITQKLRVPVKIVEVEPILGGDSLTVHYYCEDRVEVQDLGRDLSHHFKARVHMHHVGARDEARLTADYEKCGQYCCCKNFLKVLKPVNMKSAKVQKATLDPLKISGRCGRLMCCLRYEDSTYEDLRAKLPRKKSRVGTPEGDGIVIDSQILTQLSLIELDELGTDGKIRQVAIPVENLTPPVNAQAPARPAPVPFNERPRADFTRPGGQKPRPDSARPEASRPDTSRPDAKPQDNPRPDAPRQDARPDSPRGDSSRADSPRQERRPNDGQRRDNRPQGGRPQDQRNADQRGGDQRNNDSRPNDQRQGDPRSGNQGRPNQPRQQRPMSPRPSDDFGEGELDDLLGDTPSQRPPRQGPRNNSPNNPPANRPPNDRNAPNNQSGQQRPDDNRGGRRRRRRGGGGGGGGGGNRPPNGPGPNPSGPSSDPSSGGPGAN